MNFQSKFSELNNHQTITSCQYDRGVSYTRQVLAGWMSGWMLTGLLQRVAVRHLWRSYSTATVSRPTTERGGTARHWCFPT